METENVMDYFDFDISEYLKSDSDNPSLMCEDFDFDLDRLAGIDHNCSSPLVKSETEPVKNDINFFITNFCKNEINVPENSKSSFRTNKIIVPEFRMTKDVRREFQKISNPLVICLSKKDRNSNRRRTRLKNERCRKSLKSYLRFSDRQFSLDFEINNEVGDNTNRMLPEISEKDLLNFAHKEGCVLLPKNEKINVLTANSNFIENKKLLNVSIPIHYANIDSKSYWLMKSLCRDGIDCFAVLNGTVLFPKVEKSPEIPNENVCDKNIKIKSESINYEYNDIKNIDESVDDYFKSNYLPVDALKNMANNMVVKEEESVSNDKIKTDDEFLSHIYPKFKLRYLFSLRKRVERIDRLPLPNRPIELPMIPTFTDEEVTLMPEFFSTQTLSDRYLRIRNHILMCWKLNRPLYVSKTHVRFGLKTCGDVNVIGIVHRYLERRGAINFGCDLVHYAKEKI